MRHFTPQVATALCAAVVVFITGESLETGRKIGATTLLVLGCVSALALVLGQYPYFYLTVAFIQMLKAFSPAYMICFLFCLGAEPPVAARRGTVLRKDVPCVSRLRAFVQLGRKRVECASKMGRVSRL